MDRVDWVSSYRLACVLLPGTLTTPCAAAARGPLGPGGSQRGSEVLRVIGRLGVGCSMARLDFIVSQSLSISKAEAVAKIRAELVRVNGSIVRSPSCQVVLGGIEEVSIEGKKARPLFHRLLLMHKPPGCVTARAHKKPKTKHRASIVGGSAQSGAASNTACVGKSTERTVFDIIPKELNHSSLGPFGRLDKDTTGLLLLGSDGGLQSLLTHPAGNVTKQ